MVYVDDFYAPYTRMIMCHMIADSLEELHEMADKIGMTREWFQGDHYDISKTLRKKAVALGAREITTQQASAMLRCWRMTGSMPLPEEAHEERKRLISQTKQRE